MAMHNLFKWKFIKKIAIFFLVSFFYIAIFSLLLHAIGINIEPPYVIQLFFYWGTISSIMILIAFETMNFCIYIKKIIFTLQNKKYN